METILALASMRALANEELRIKRTRVYSAVSIARAELAQLPESALWFVARFLAPFIGPMVRTSRSLWDAVKADAALWSPSIQRMQTTRRGREALKRAAYSLIDRMPELNTFLPLPVVDDCERIALALDGYKLATSLRSGVVVLLDGESLLGTTTIKRTGWACFSPDGTQVACGSLDRVDLFDVRTGELLGTCAVVGENFWRVAYLRDGTLVSCSSWSGTVVVWNPPAAWTWLARQLVTPSGSPKHVIAHGGEGGVSALAASPVATAFATGRAKGTLQIWSAQGTKLLDLVPAHALQVNDVAFTSDGFKLVSAGDDACVCVWDATNGASLQVLRPMVAVCSIAVSASGLLAMALASEDRIEFFRLGSDRRVGALQVQRPELVRFSALELELELDDNVTMTQMFVVSEGNLVVLSVRDEPVMAFA